jgi:hypothetical protein
VHKIHAERLERVQLRRHGLARQSFCSDVAHSDQELIRVGKVAGNRGAPRNVLDPHDVMGKDLFYIF